MTSIKNWLQNHKVLTGGICLGILVYKYSS